MGKHLSTVLLAAVAAIAEPIAGLLRTCACMGAVRDEDRGVQLYRDGSGMEDLSNDQAAIGTRSHSSGLKGDFHFSCAHHEGYNPANVVSVEKQNPQHFIHRETV